MTDNERVAVWAGLCFHSWEIVGDTTASPYARCRKCLYCGLKFSTELSEWELPKCADGDVYFDESLDALFKWVVPKLDQAQYYAVLRSIFVKTDKPAQALFKAVLKLIEELGV